jgi:phage terminase large subunit
MSTEYDMVVVLEATEISEHDWEQLLSRLRNGVMPYQQAIADVNPDAPTHWANRRASSGQMTRILSRHEDNPKWFNPKTGKLTAAGERYIATLDRLTGVRHLRLRKGVWAAAEGMVYSDWDANVHLVDRFDVPASWRRIRVIDFGYTNPFVCQWWAIDGDGRMFLYRELYGTKTLVAKWAEQITHLSEGETIEATISDHDAEDRATLHAAGIQTVAARKDVTPGIQATQSRMQKAEDGKPRLFLMRDSLVKRDELLAEAKKPVCTVEEVEGYVWPKGQDGKPMKEVPVKENDHGMDTMRYAVAYVDGINATPFEYAVSVGGNTEDSDHSETSWATTTDAWRPL